MANIIGEKPDLSGPGPDIMAVDALEGCEVVNLASENLGEIQDIMIDVRSGHVAYAVLSFGGLLGIGNKLFAVPWDALTLDAERRCFVLDIERDRLERASGFDKSHWPSMPGSGWSRGERR